MAAPLRNSAVPAALRPVASPPPVQPQLPPPATERTAHHLAIVVPDARVHQLIAGRCWVMGPSTLPVTGHVFLEDRQHPMRQADQWFRWAMAETGLLTPAEIGLVVPVQVELGWAKHEQET